MKTGNKLTIIFFVIYFCLPIASQITNRTIWNQWCKENLDKFANTEKIRVLELHGEDLTERPLTTTRSIQNANLVTLNCLPEKLEVSGDTLRMWLPRQRANYNTKYYLDLEGMYFYDLEYIFVDGRPARRAELVEYTNPETGETSKAVQYSPID